MAFSFGTQGGTSYSVPAYTKYDAQTIFPPSGGMNPLDSHTAQPFNRIIGPQTLVVTNSGTGFTWSIDLEGGSNTLSNGYVGMYNQASNYIITSEKNCTVVGISSPLPTTTRLNRFQITTSAPDSKVYVLQYSPFTGVFPTITLNAPSVIGANTLTLNTYYIRLISG